jgi:hypothetical protein
VPRTSARKGYTNQALQEMAAQHAATAAELAALKASKPTGVVGDYKVVSNANQLMAPTQRKLTDADYARIISCPEPRAMARSTLDTVMRKLGIRADAGEQSIFLRELENVFREPHDIEYAELKGKQMVPVRYDLDPGAETFTYTSFDRRGVAKRVKDFSTDFPRVNVFGSQFLNPVVSYGVSYAYSIDELRAALKAGRSIESMRAFAARKAIDEMIDQVLSNGDPDVDNGAQSGLAPMQGILTLTGTQTGTASSLGTGSTTTWWNPNTAALNKTQDQIIADVTGVITSVPYATKGVEKVRRIVLPIFQMGILKNTPRSTVSDTTLLAFLEKNNPDIEFMDWERLTGAGAANTNFAQNAPGDLLLAYNPDRSKLFAPIAIEWEQLAPQLDNLSYKVPCRAKLGGVACPYPLSLYFLSGI